MGFLSYVSTLLDPKQTAVNVRLGGFVEKPADWGTDENLRLSVGDPLYPTRDISSTSSDFLGVFSYPACCP